jgi:hypothetical protein
MFSLNRPKCIVDVIGEILKCAPDLQEVLQPLLDGVDDIPSRFEFLLWAELDFRLGMLASGHPKLVEINRIIQGPPQTLH